jgi:CLIP-associating protein 1/2
MRKSMSPSGFPRSTLSGDEIVRKQIQDIIDELQNVKTQSRSNERRSSMTQLIRLTRDGNCSIIKEKFRDVLRLLLENLSDEMGSTRALVFGVLTEMLKQESLISSFQGFTELIILIVLEAHRDDEKDVERAAEACAAAMAGVLPPDVVIRVLNPIVKTGEYPVNQAAIKMLTKVAEHESSKEIVVEHLADIMPGLLRAYDNVESSVRKASVFCMVGLHQMVGDQLQPHLASLNGSKLKLLNLYIKRAEAQSMPASPRLTPP